MPILGQVDLETFLLLCLRNYRHSRKDGMASTAPGFLGAGSVPAPAQCHPLSLSGGSHGCGSWWDLLALCQ